MASSWLIMRHRVPIHACRVCQQSSLSRCISDYLNDSIPCMPVTYQLTDVSHFSLSLTIGSYS